MQRGGHADILPPGKFLTLSSASWPQQLQIVCLMIASMLQCCMHGVSGEWDLGSFKFHEWVLVWRAWLSWMSGGVSCMSAGEQSACLGLMSPFTLPLTASCLKGVINEPIEPLHVTLSSSVWVNMLYRLQGNTSQYLYSWLQRTSQGEICTCTHGAYGAIFHRPLLHSKTGSQRHLDHVKFLQEHSNWKSEYWLRAGFRLVEAHGHKLCGGLCPS
jgi:hypothetical protein